jgi:large subunit ribosomal protein L6
MSRIGKKLINIPEGVTVEVKEGIFVAKGPKGEFSQPFNPAFKVVHEDNTLSVVRPSESKAIKSQHGLYRALIQNVLVGVTEGYKLELEFVGVGYKAVAQGNVLEMSLGFSHNIHFAAPAEVKISSETLKGKNPIVTIEGIDKQLVGQVAAKIRSYRKPEPYKGKGVRFVGENIRRKAGKTAAK